MIAPVSDVARHRSPRFQAYVGSPTAAIGLGQVCNATLPGKPAPGWPSLKASIYAASACNRDCYFSYHTSATSSRRSPERTDGGIPSGTIAQPAVPGSRCPEATRGAIGSAPSPSALRFAPLPTQPRPSQQRAAGSCGPVGAALQPSASRSAPPRSYSKGGPHRPAPTGKPVGSSPQPPASRSAPPCS
jgi:hypothetical protein